MWESYGDNHLFKVINSWNGIGGLESLKKGRGVDWRCIWGRVVSGKKARGLGCLKMEREWGKRDPLIVA